MSLSARFTATALRLINQRGATVSYVEISKGEYDADAGKNTVAKKSRNVKALIAELKESNAERGVVAGDMKLTMAGANFTARKPKPADRVIFNGLEYTVVTHWPTYVEDTAVCLDVIARRA